MSQIGNLRAKLPSDANVQIADSVDSAVAALSNHPAAVMVPDNALGEASCERVRTAVARYVHNGGRLITDLDEVKAVLGGAGHWDSDYANRTPIGQTQSASITTVSTIRTEHLVR